ncbi:acyl-CoA dehydrogenase family protein [Terricaulis sp.]|uniref:acyl-CoA dehydrogenase family protein n=1 Tax=Terricaulis sp. TaxID=2768686 RepID=UPI003783E5F9
MDEALDLSELRDAVRGALNDRALTIPGEEGRPVDRQLWTDMAALGWLGLGISAGHGGLGQRFAHLAVLHEELGRKTASVPALSTFTAAGLIAAHGSAALQQRVLPAIAAGEMTAAIADPLRASFEVKAKRVSGGAEDVLFAADVDLVLVPIDAGFVALSATDGGVTVANQSIVDLTRRMGRLRLESVNFDKDALIALGATERAAFEDELAVAVACDAIGGAQAIFERTVDYLGIREQFGRPIGSFQALKHRAAHWKVQLEAAAALVRQAALALSVKEPASALASSAKFYACDLYAAVAEDAIQLHGGIGFTWEHPCHLYLKRAKLNQVLFGSSSAHKERIARLAFTQTATPKSGAE